MRIGRDIKQDRLTKEVAKRIIQKHKEAVAEQAEGGKQTEEAEEAEQAEEAEGGKQAEVAEVAEVEGSEESVCESDPEFDWGEHISGGIGL